MDTPSSSSNRSDDVILPYFCHRCNAYKQSVTRDYMCPTCNSGHIEEIEPPPESESDLCQCGSCAGIHIFEDSSDEEDLVVESVDSTEHHVAAFLEDNVTIIIKRTTRYPDNHVQEEIANIPIELISKDCLDTKHNCTICCNYFTTDEDKDKKKKEDKEIKVLRFTCGHMYHKECIFPWLKRQCTCPICRKGLVNEICFVEFSQSEAGSVRENQRSYTIVIGARDEHPRDPDINSSDDDVADATPNVSADIERPRASEMNDTSLSATQSSATPSVPAVMDNHRALNMNELSSATPNSFADIDTE